MDNKILDITSHETTRNFRVKVIRKGEKYGIFTHEKDDPLVEFWDLHQANQKCWGPDGQFVSRYYRSTLLDGDSGAGLDLQGGVPAWKVDSEAMDKVRDWLGDRICSDCKRDLLPKEVSYCEPCGKQRAFEAEAGASIPSED